MIAFIGGMLLGGFIGMFIGGLAVMVAKDGDTNDKNRKN